ncbi:MAG: radical SAM protein [Planctomycetota bacterium]|nr:radical SAM protein [Planctomycetota bacterium]
MKRHLLRIVVPAYPTFNIYSRIACKTTALGPVCVATAAREIGGWDAEVIDENNLGRYGPRGAVGADHQVLQAQRSADIVGFYGGLTSTIPRLYELARWYRRQGATTVAGGQHFAGENVDEALANGIDYVVLGEGEETIRELIDALQGRTDLGAVKGIAYLRDGTVFRTAPREPLADFDRFAMPDFSLVRYARIRIYPVERVRGCGMNCEFCTVKGVPRGASADRLFENMRHLVETRDARHFFIVDDLFGQQRAEAIRFCRMLADYQQRIGRRLVATVQIRLDKARDRELLTAMREAGVAHVAIGFESPIDEELKAMNKQVRAEEMLSLVKVYRQFGFWVHGMFIFGYPALPDQAFTMPVAERVRRFRRFIRKARLDTVQVLLPVPLPGTRLRQRLERQCRVYGSDDVGWEYYDGNFPLFEPDAPLTAQQMQRGTKWIMGRFYRFQYMFLVGASILTFPALVFSLHNLRAGWSRWYLRWARCVIRFGGWLTMRKWTSDFRKSDFLARLQKARGHLNVCRDMG